MITCRQHSSGVRIMKTIISNKDVVAGKKSRLIKGLSAIALATCLLTISQFGLLEDSFAQESLAPPTLGDDTKGTPAVAERQPLPVETTSTQTAETTDGETAEATDEDETFGPLGQATITETRRDSGGQVYRVELEHSIGGGKQILEESDSDGQLETRSTGLEEEVNIPKWNIFSW